MYTKILNHIKYPLLDAFLIILSYIFVCFGFALGYKTNLITYINIIDIPILIFIYCLFLYFFKLYNQIWRVAGTREFLAGIISCFCSLLVSSLLLVALLNRNIYAVVTINILCCISILSLRLFVRIEQSIFTIFKTRNCQYGKRTLIIGAGMGASGVIAEMNRHINLYHPIAIVDDDPNKKNTYLCGVKVYGDRTDIHRLTKELNIELIVFAIAKIDNSAKREILKICFDTNIQVKILPSIYELMAKKDFLPQIRPINIADLLGRDEINIDYGEISTYISGKTVLVTGGGGSIGSELCRQIAAFNPKKLLILDIYENNAYNLQIQLTRNNPELSLSVIIASVRDKNRLNEIFKKEKPDVVFHAAAHKHVPLMEMNPMEAIKNNIMGTWNVANCANTYGTKRFVLISTDKAVNPTNIMGATKRVCELIIQSFDNISQTEYVAVRFGNVLGSNGSVIPLFQEQIACGGPVTVTHKEITRFFMSIPEAAQLVAQAGAYARGGEIFVLDMGSPVKIYNLAEDVIINSGLKPHKDIKIDIVGLRPGEKLYEELLLNEDGLRKTAHDLIFVEKPLAMDFDELSSKIQELNFLANSNNQIEAINKLSELVPTYHKELQLV